MDDAKEIVKANFDSYNKKLLIQDGLLVIALLFLCINYLLVVEPNYQTFTDIAANNKQIEILNSKIITNKSSIIKLLPVSVQGSLGIKDSQVVNDQVFEKVTPYLEQDQQDMELLNKRVTEIKQLINEKASFAKQNEDYKNDILAANDAISLVKVLLFINHGRTHFALFLSYVILIILIYFFITRTYLLNLLARTLRIQKEKLNLNQYYEYHVTYSIWLAPIPKLASYTISAEELLNVLSIRNTHDYYVKVLKICFIILICLQFRLYFIELSINQYFLSIFSGLILLNFIATILIVYFWLTRQYIPDNYNCEKPKNEDLTRREFVKLGGSVMAITLLALSVPALSYYKEQIISFELYNRIFNSPRFLKTGGSRRKANWEEAYMKLVADRQYDKAIKNLLLEIKTTAVTGNYSISKMAVKQVDLIIRLLMFMIYRRQESKYNSIMTQLNNVIQKSTDNVLHDRVIQAGKPDYKWKRVCERNSSIIKWNKILLS